MSQENKAMSAVFMTVLFGFAGFSLPYPVFGPMFLKPELGFLDPSVPEQYRTILLGVAMALYPIGQFIGAPWLGRLSDKVGRKPVLMASLFGAASGYIVVAIGVANANLPMVLIGRFVSGLCEGNMAIAQSIASDISKPENKVRNFGLITVAINVGWIIGPLMGGFFSDPSIHPSFNVSWPFFFAAGMYGFNLLVVAVILHIPEYARRRGRASDDEAVPTRSVWATLTDPVLLPGYAVSFFSYVAIYLFFCFFGVYLVQNYDVTSSFLGMCSAIISIPLILAGLTVERAQRPMGLRGVAILGHLLLATGLVTFVLPEGLVWIFVPMCLAAFGIAWCEVTTSLFISNGAGAHEQGQALGIYRSVHVLAEAAAVLMGGVLAGLNSDLPFIVGSVASLICVVGILGWVKSRSAEPAGAKATASAS
ncbi:MAG: MFS transporter [Thalassospira sp.]|uniref:MFS transporter n=1 Tax=Thalassospira sp. TaxID=1912094 RepID=UPI003A8889A0